MRPFSPILRLSPYAPAPDEAPPKPGERRRAPHEAGTIDRIRTLVETTPLSFREIARQTGASAATVSRHAKAGGWVRPNPKPPLDHYTEEGRRYAEALALEVASGVGSAALTGVAENRVAFVARDGVAGAAAGILIGEGHAGAIYTATGDRVYTGAERAALISEITGKPVGFVAIPADALRGGMARAGLPENVINTWVSIQNDFAAGAFDIVTGDVERLAGRAPKSLHDALSAALH